jgi:diguanylate cyclase (GGDEF)-like protein
LADQLICGGSRPLIHKPPAETRSPSAPTSKTAAIASASTATVGQTEPRDILNSIGAVVYDWDILTDRIQWGANRADVLGDMPTRAMESGDAYADIVADNSESSRFQAILHSGRIANDEGAPYRAQYGLVREGGDVIAVEDFGRWFSDAAGRPIRAHGVVRVLADHSVKSLRFDVNRRDPLTGAYSRARLIEHINGQCGEANRRGSHFAVLVISIDRLQSINLSYGYDVADEMIMTVARRLRECLRATDIIARYLGGKFAVALDGCDAEQCSLLARRILQTTSKEPLRAVERNVRISLSIGASLMPKHGRTAQALLQRAEEACEYAFAAGGGLTIYAPTLASRAAEARVLAGGDEIVAALNERRIVLAYQPVAPARGDRPRYYEALLRIRDDKGGLVGPSAILPIAEKVGLLAQLDQRVLELALKRMSAEPELRLAVNVSPTTIREPDWLDRLVGALAAHPGAAERFIIEVTESQAIADIETTARLFEQVRKLGVRIAMDDFGAGHTSFRNLRALGVDIIKIDGAFVQNIARSADDRFFVRTLLELARNLKVETVAEWVEDAEATRILMGWGVDYLQGHFFGVADTIEADPPKSRERAPSVA